MSHILFKLDSSLSVLISKCETQIVDIIRAYLQNILSKSSITSSHIQTLVQDDNITVSLYYRSLKDDNENLYIICFICDGKTFMSPFYHELDKYSDSLCRLISSADNIVDTKSCLDSWYESCIEYVLRVVDFFRNDLAALLYIALSRNNIEIHATKLEGQIVIDTQKFISSCSLKELMYNTEVVFSPISDPEESVMIDFDNKIVNYETNSFCRKWAETIAFESDAFQVRQILEDYKVTANEDMNTFRRLLHLAEADHYAFFQGYEFIKLHENGKILFEMLTHESTVYSLDNLENLLDILQKFRLYKENQSEDHGR